MGKLLIVGLILCAAWTSQAETFNEQEYRSRSFTAAMNRACPPKNQETWKAREQREKCEEEFKLQYFDLSQKESSSSGGRDGSALKDPGPCMGDCASELGICISRCGGNGNCIGNCASVQGRCESRCY